MYNYKTASTLAICILFVCIILLVSSHGKNNRIFSSGNTFYTVDDPEKAYYIWKESNVRGRTLVLFDSYPHNMGLFSYNGSPHLTKTNLVEFSIFQNIVRRIYFVVPEADWNDFRRQKFIRPIREASDLVKGLYLYNQSGIPIIAVTQSSLPHISEETLVYINSNRFKSKEALELLAQNKISSDIIIIYESTPR
jgi:hypothetical protein